MKEVIVFGGSFNPPTLGHVEIMRHCLAQSEIDEVWVMPCGQRKDKAFTATDEQRLEMLHEIKNDVFGGEKRLVITNFEMNLPAPTETIKTLGALGVKAPDTRFWFAFGVDAYRSMESWDFGAWMKHELPMYLVPRDGDEPPEAPNVRVLPPVSDVSSTLVREAVAENRPASKYVPQIIEQYIAASQLYVQPVQ